MKNRGWDSNVLNGRYDEQNTRGNIIRFPRVLVSFPALAREDRKGQV